MNKTILARSWLFTAAIALIAVVPGISAAAISRGYVSDDNDLKPGMLVKLSRGSTADVPRVERATNDEPDKILGVATKAADSAVTIASAQQSVYVEISGKVEVFATDLTGDVKKGDLLTISPIKGIVAKLTDTSSVVLGVALEDFPTSGVETHEITSADGEKSVNIAKMQINLDQKGVQASAKADSSLERLGHSVVGKDVNELRVAVALIIFLLVLVAEGGILYGAISSALTSLGRNPMAKNVINKELVQVVGVALMVLVLGVAAVYLVLWL